MRSVAHRAATATSSRAFLSLLLTTTRRCSSTSTSAATPPSHPVNASTTAVANRAEIAAAVAAAAPKTTPRGNTTVEQLTGAVEARRRTVHRATDAERAGYEAMPDVLGGEEAKWWPIQEEMRNSMMFTQGYDMTVRRKDGLNTVEMKELPHPDKPEELSFATENFLNREAAGVHMIDEVYDEVKRLDPPSTFDPAIDEIDDDGFQDQNVVIDVLKAVDEDKRRLEAFGNPVTMEEQVDALLQPQRTTDESVAQRQEFNGFSHWGLLHAAHMLLDENQDVKKAHEFVNRYLRDLDLFRKWLEHPKVRAHIQKKFGVDMKGKFDPTMALTMSLYTRSKIQVYQDDPAAALKSLVGAMSALTEGGLNLKLDRHRKVYGALLIARGMVYTKLKSYERGVDDLTRAMAFVNANRSPTLYQLRAEALEGLGRIEEARQDEESAAMMWEEAEVVRPGLAAEPQKFVI
ncbi:Hypothetical protein, putative [Bodo saltans]|uniref:Uncharacterized protein n=1 Tax=Bodo saltans TaxID=75058 RepID=A0A0S4JP89_BODSA|nr:Hypothetical protein, putative [Bodo saltans]|eukprot:CUG91167.1 Hypothetical protein, putative [Bodo saltans]